MIVVLQFIVRPIPSFSLPLCPTYHPDRIILNRRMQPSQVQFRYRSIKYSTSSFSLPSHPQPSTNPPPKSRLSLASQSASTPQLLLKPPQKKVGTKEKEKENKWSPIHPSHPPSSHYKLRIVANSSYLRTRCSEAEEEKPVQVANERNEEQYCLILPVSSGYPSFQPCLTLLQENVDSLQPLLEEQRKQTQRIQQSLIDIRKHSEVQLIQGQCEIQSKLQKLRNQLRIAFKEHSKQIINTREAVSHLRNDLQTLSSFASQVDKELAYQESTLYGP